jgi:hypothetical protein
MKKTFVIFILSFFFLFNSMPFLAFATTEKVTKNGNAVSTTVFDGDKIVSDSTTYYQSDGTTIRSIVTDTYNSAGTGIATKQQDTYNSAGTGIATKLQDTYDSTGTKVISRDVFDANGNITQKNIVSYENGLPKEEIVTKYDSNGAVSSNNKYEYSVNSEGKTMSTVSENCGLLNPSADCYTPLAPIKGPDGQEIDTKSFPAYLQAIYRVGIGACFVLGVIMFTWAGIEYIVSESMDTKSDAKKRITGALIGLAIALVSYILLNTINPALLQFTDIKKTTVTNSTK